MSWRLGPKHESDGEARAAQLAAQEDQLATRERDLAAREDAVKSKEEALDWASSFGLGVRQLYDSVSTYLWGKADKYVDKRVELLAESDHRGTRSDPAASADQK